jgi:hypothetical protein
MLGAGSYALENHYANEKPTSPDPLIGRVNEFNVHGRFVYLNEKEVYLKAGIMGGALLFMVLGGWLWSISGKATTIGDGSS